MPESLNLPGLKNVALSRQNDRKDENILLKIKTGLQKTLDTSVSQSPLDESGLNLPQLMA